VGADDHRRCARRRRTGGAPEAIRLVLLRVRVPRYQRDVVVALAEREGVAVDEIVSRQLEDLVCAVGSDLGADVGALTEP
jgi:hypothetical protein